MANDCRSERKLCGVRGSVVHQVEDCANSRIALPVIMSITPTLPLDGAAAASETASAFCTARIEAAQRLAMQSITMAEGLKRELDTVLAMNEKLRGADSDLRKANASLLESNAELQRRVATVSDANSVFLAQLRRCSSPAPAVMSEAGQRPAPRGQDATKQVTQATSARALVGIETRNAVHCALRFAKDIVRLVATCRRDGRADPLRPGEDARCVTLSERYELLARKIDERCDLLPGCDLGEDAEDFERALAAVKALEAGEAAGSAPGGAAGSVSGEAAGPAPGEVAAFAQSLGLAPVSGEAAGPAPGEVAAFAQSLGLACAQAPSREGAGLALGRTAGKRKREAGAAEGAGEEGDSDAESVSSMKTHDPRLPVVFKARDGADKDAEEAAGEAMGPCSRLTGLARASGGAPACLARAQGVSWQEPVVAEVFEAPQPLRALEQPRHTLLTGELWKVRLTRPDGMRLKYAQHALCMPWDAAIWHRKGTKWHTFCFNLADQRVAYYLAEDVDAGKAVVPLDEERIKELIASRLQGMPVQEYIEHGARAKSVRGLAHLALYKHVFPDKDVQLGYEEVDVLQAERAVDERLEDVLTSVTLRCTQLARPVLDLKLKWGARAPRYWGLWTVPRERGGRAVPNDVRWGEHDAAAKARYMARVERQLLGDERLFGRA
jgi:hypothetical protein